MRIAELMAGLQELGALPAPLPAGWRNAAGVAVRGVTADSREVDEGALFVAIPGTRADGRQFIADAVSRGAAAVLAPPGTGWPPGVPPRPLLEDPEPRRRLAQIAALLAGLLPRVQVAVTGTNGKTSTVDFLRQIWEQAGQRAASLGTLGLIAPGFGAGPGLTTPDPVALAKTMAALARAEVQHVALEASSHGLDQFRLDGLRLTAAGFTNLTRDHLDYHGTIERYRAAKLRLFNDLLRPGAVVVASTALDAESLAALREICAARRLELRLVGEGGTGIELIAVRPLPEGQALTLRLGGVRREIVLPLPGRFQAENALLAAALAMATGTTQALDLLPRLAPVRGRMELAARLANGAAVYVDYAHTPDALDRLLTALRPHTAGRLHVAFGAGGDRDPGKRPMMGAVATRLADRVIVTDDNPRSERPAAIRAAILAASPDALEVAGREAAIAAALEGLGPGDVLAVAGKGHEQGQIIGTQVLPFDDVAVVRRLAGTS
jgi:UDP-N-acetylmuramoyl-L-alanyl-D-glutamate--2,6-diaminopimelate ligase